MRRLLLFTLLLARPAIAADVPLSPSEFEALVTGHTLSYSSRSQVYGVEEYFDGRRVRWAFGDGQCIEGTWYDAGDQVCFVYEGFDTPQCWSFFLRNDSLVAKYHNDPGLEPLHETKRQKEPLFCPGPDVGV